MTLTGHGIADQRIEAVAGAAARFFRLSNDAKLDVAPRRWNATNPNTYRGYFPSSVNGKEGLDIGDPQLDPSRIGLLRRPYYELNRFPSKLGDEWFDSVSRYFDALSTLGRVLLEVMVASLGGDPGRVAGAFSRPESLSTLRFNYYPNSSEPVEISNEDGSALACETHVDSGLVTILHQDDRGGLEVRDRGGRWRAVPYQRGAFVVNTGRALEQITNGVFRATPHRVLLARGERLSIPFFLEPRHDWEVAPASFGLGGPAPGEALSYEVFLRESLEKFVEYDRNP